MDRDDDATHHPAPADALRAPTDSPPPPVADSSGDASQALALLKELGGKLTEELLVWMPKLFLFLEHDDPVVVRQTIASGTRFFCAVLEEMALQLQKSGMVEGWLDKMWAWMVQFKDTISGIVLEHGSAGTKVLAVKFLEVCIELFTSDTDDTELPFIEGKERNFNVSWLVQGHPTLNPPLLAAEADRSLGFLLDILQSSNTDCGSFNIAVISSLAAIARKRPLHYSRILSSLLSVEPNLETLKGGHAPSLRYSLKTAIVGFLRCTHPTLVESREKLLRVLRAINPGEATDLIIRQVEKMSKSTERVSRDVRVNKDDLLSSQISVVGDLMRKRPVSELNDTPVFDDMPAKRIHLLTSNISNQHAQLASDLQDDVACNDFSSKTSLINSNSSPVENMIAMIGALLAEGERGAESLDLLISNIHADLLADIVIETMKHLPKSQLGQSGRPGNIPVDSQVSSSTISLQTGPAASITISVQASALSSQITSAAADDSGSSTPTSDMPSFNNLPADSKRDPRRDRHRLDPRRVAETVAQHSLPLNLENSGEILSGLSHSLSRPSPASEHIIIENAPASLTPKKEMEISESSLDPLIEQLSPRESLAVRDVIVETEPPLEVPKSSNLVVSPVHDVEEEVAASNESDITGNEDVGGDMLESDHYSSSLSTAFVSDDICHDFPMVPLYVDLTGEQKKAQCKLAVTRIIEGSQQIRATGRGHARLPLLARLVAQMDPDDDIIILLQKHIILDYHHEKGHELAMHVLYYLRTIMISEPDEYSSSFAANHYEKFILSVAKALLDSLPATDKSFSRLLGEAPFLPDSVLRLLEDLCHSRYYNPHGKDVCDGDRVTQGLGSVWSLILGRPLNREACLGIALKCAVYSLDEVRAKAIRLVANKLYLLNYASEHIERFATSMLLSVVDQQEKKLKPVDSCGHIEATFNQETSVSSSQNSELGASENESTKGTQASFQSDNTMSFSCAQQQTSLFFALCTKRPSLLQVIFDTYGRAPKAVKQSVHRHLPILVRTLGSSHSALLQIISDPPEGSENLIMLVLQIMTEESTPTDELITAVKHLYETKLKDAAILIPMLSSLSKDEVLPIFPRLVDLPLEKFQAALARILQGSAHTGPALTPVEVVVAIHDISPQKDGVALKKITDACTACFEQRTVFTQHVLEKSLSHLVEKFPLPLLLMRTVIQAIDAFPTMVDFVMGLLSTLVNKQIWKMPKLWVGFLKCASQTQPHSFHVLLQLPPPQLENALSRYTNLRGPLAAFVNQSNTRSSFSRQTLRILGLVNEPQQTVRPYIPAAFQAADTSSSVHGSTLT